jgi:hypothetical protein
MIQSPARDEICIKIGNVGVGGRRPRRVAAALAALRTPPSADRAVALRPPLVWVSYELHAAACRVQPPHALRALLAGTWVGVACRPGGALCSAVRSLTILCTVARDRARPSASLRVAYMHGHRALPSPSLSCVVGRRSRGHRGQWWMEAEPFTGLLSTRHVPHTTRVLLHHV